MTFFDLNSKSPEGHTSGSPRKEMAHELRKNSLCATDGFYPRLRVPEMRRPIQRRLQGKDLFVLGPVSFHGFCPAYLQGKPEGHRGLSPVGAVEALPSWDTGKGIQEHPCKCQSDKGLANICRPCPVSDREGPKAVHQRFLRDGTGQCRLRPGFHHHRSLPLPFSMGHVQEAQGGGETPYPSGPAGQYPHGGHCHPWEGTRCEHPRSDHRGGRSFLCNGPGIHGLCPSSPYAPVGGLLRHTGKKQLPFQASLFAVRGQISGGSVRSDRYTGKLLCKKGLSFKAQEDPLLRQGKEQTDSLSDQQLHPARRNYCRSVPLSMADRALLQMDQAASPDKSILRHFGERGEDPDMDRHLGLCSCGNSEKASEAGSESLYNFADSKRHAFREDAHFAGAFSCRIQQIRGLYL